MSDKLYRILRVAARMKGIGIVEVPFDFLAGSLCRGKKRFCIAIKPDLDLKEKAKTLAHELAHWLLHRKTVNQGLYFLNKEYQEVIEGEADRLAERMIERISRKQDLCFKNMQRYEEIETEADRFALRVQRRIDEEEAAIT